MIAYKTKSKELAGTNLGEVYKNAWKLYHEIEKKTRRKPYIRSAYFKKEKVFFDYFWTHLTQKGPKERFKRLKLFRPSLAVIQSSRNKPVIKSNPNNKNELLYRFAGQTREGKLFIVQIKENLKNRRKYLMSCFPVE